MGARILSCGIPRTLSELPELGQTHFARREDARPIVYAHDQLVGRSAADRIGHVHLERFVAPEATADRPAVDENPAIVLHPPKTNLQPHPARQLIGTQVNIIA